MRVGQLSEGALAGEEDMLPFLRRTDQFLLSGEISVGNIKIVMCL